MTSIYQATLWRCADIGRHVRVELVRAGHCDVENMRFGHICSKMADEEVAALRAEVARLRVELEVRGDVI